MDSTRRQDKPIQSLQCFHAKNKCPISAVSVGQGVCDSTTWLLATLGCLLTCPHMCFFAVKHGWKEAIPCPFPFNHAGQGLGKTWGVGGRQTVCLGLLYVSKQATTGCQPYFTHTHRIETHTHNRATLVMRVSSDIFLISFLLYLDALCKTNIWCMCNKMNNF